MTGSYRSAFFHCASEVIGDEQLRYAAQGRSGNGCGHLTMTSCPDLRTLQRRYSWTPPITATKIATRRISPVSGLITGTVGPQKSIKSFSPARCSLAHGETSRFFPTPGSNGRSASIPSLCYPPVPCIPSTTVAASHPGFLISVSRYNMSGITSSDAKVSLGGKNEFLQRVMGYISR